MVSFLKMRGTSILHCGAVRANNLYRSFRVVSANNANTRAPIQKRMITYDSCQPNCSKW